MGSSLDDKVVMSACFGPKDAAPHFRERCFYGVGVSAPLGWLGHRWVPSPGKNCGCPAVLPQHCQAAVVQVLVKLCLGVLAEDIHMGSTHPACSELMEIHFCPCTSVVFSSRTHLFLRHFGCKLPCAVASPPILPQMGSFSTASLHLSGSPLASLSSASLEHLWEKGNEHTNVIKNVCSY